MAVLEHVDQWKLASMPSGVPPGEPLGDVLLKALATHAETPPAYQPVIEEGTYDEFKACVFRVCSFRVCEVALENMRAEIEQRGIRCEMNRRDWKYVQQQAMRCVTVVEIRLEADAEKAEAIKDVIAYLSRAYEFQFSKQNYQTYRERDLNNNNSGYFTPVRIVVELEIMWPYWT